MNETSSDSQQVTVNQITAQIRVLRDLRIRKAELAKPVKEVQDQDKSCQARLIELLNTSGLKTLKTEFGKATVVQTPSVRIPETPDDMEIFLNFVKEHDPDIFKAKVCMKSADINEYYEMKLEEARAAGKDLEVPGIGGESFRETLSFTKA